MSRFFRLNSIRDRIQGGFLLLSLLIVALAIFSALVINRTRKIAAIHSDINELQVHSLNLIKTDNDFFNMEIYNQRYLKTRNSKLILQRDSLKELIRVRINHIISKSSELDYEVSHHLIEIDTLLSTYNSTFSRLEELFFARGFKDEGLEGKMRFYAHELEQPSSGFDKLDLLSLRRLEKDFMIRHDTIYVANFNHLVQSITGDLSRKSMGRQELENLSSYHALFVNLVEVQKHIGLSATEGLRGKLSQLTEALSERYFTLAHESLEISSEAQKDVWLVFVLTAIAAILFSILTGYWISRRISEPIARLSKVMEEAVEKRYRMPEFSLSKAAIEINILTASFSKLMNETNQQMKELKKKSGLLKKSNTELKKLNSELDGFLYSTAHDLRSPLSSLLGILNLMLIENRQKELVVYIEMMQKTIKTQEVFISQIVEFTKNKRMDLIPEKIDLNLMIEEIFTSHLYVEGASRISNEITVHGESLFYSDKNRMKIIFSNLISNAIKYADFNKQIPSIRISIEITREEVSIQFSDNGIGIEEHHLERVFDMFYRANHDSKGSGLGLFIFSETIQKLKGFMTVQSKVKQGTSFFIRLPNLSPEYQIPFGKALASI